MNRHTEALKDEQSLRAALTHGEVIILPHLIGKSGRILITLGDGSLVTVVVDKTGRLLRCV